MNYFITEEFIKSNSTVLGNVDAKLISPMVPTVADMKIKNVLGSYFYNDLLVKYNDQSLSINEITLVGMIQYAVLWYAVAEVVITSSFQITNKGVQIQNGENSEAAEKDVVFFNVQHYEQKGDFYTERIIFYLKNNKSLFPKFTSSSNTDMSADLKPIDNISGVNDIRFI